MYTPAIAICLYPEACAGGRLISGQRRSIFIDRLCSLEARAAWFLVWWLFLHRRLTNRQRGSTCVEATTPLQRLIKSSKRNPFLSGRTGKFFSNSPWQAFRLRPEASIAKSVYPPALCPQTARHRTARRSPRRSRSREKRDREADYTRE